jgi:hypothetical protein
MEAVNLKCTPAVTWEYVEIVNRSQSETRFSSTAVKNSNIQRQRLDTQCIQSYPLPLQRGGANVPLQKFLPKFGALDWIHWNVHFGIAIAQSSWRAEARMSLANVFYSGRLSL